MRDVLALGSNYPQIQVDIGFASSATTEPASISWTDVTQYVRAVQCQRGRNDELSRFDAGGMSFTLSNRTRIFDPFNASGAYYGQLLPMKPVRLRAQFSAVTYAIWQGLTEGFIPQYDNSTFDSVTQVNCVDAFKVFNLYTLKGPALAEVLTHDRIDDVLDVIDWPVNLRNLSTGLATVVEDEVKTDEFEGDATGDSLTYLQSVADSEPGALFMSADGKVTFQGKRYRIDTASSSQMTFGPGAGEYGFRDVSVSNDDSQIANVVTATHLAPNVVVPFETAEDATSKTTYLPRSFDFQTRLKYEGEAFAAASLFLYTLKDPRARFPSISLQPTKTPSDYWTKILGREISDRVTVKITPPGGGTQISQVCHIEGISHSIQPGGPWAVQLNLSPAITFTEWVLGTSTLGTDSYIGV